MDARCAAPSYFAACDNSVMALPAAGRPASL